MTSRYLALTLVPFLMLACTEDVAPDHPSASTSAGGAATGEHGGGGGGRIKTGGTDSVTGSGGAAQSAGGSTDSGGNAAGGAFSGGTTFNEPATGGATAGGGTTGSSTTGGTSSGGTASAGTATGGAATGGAATGGAATGGAATGGAEAGGAPTGGSHAGGTAAGASGAGGTGVAGGAGGGSGGTTPVTLPYGFAPTTASWDDAVLAYNDWKAVHLQDCGGGVYRVPWENAKLDATVSEGVGYGMLLSVAHEDRAAFDGLHEYYSLALDDWGLMHWLRYDCDAHRDTTYNEYPDNAAADADLDVAMSLIMAGCKWGGSYLDDAARIINALEDSTIGWDDSVALLQPGDGAFFENNRCVNYSYFAPGYYRAFAAVVPESAEFWNQLADDTYILLERASHDTTGLVRNWGSSDGGSVSGCTFDYSDDYGADAARTPWRVGVDYLWWGSPDAKSWLDRMTEWLMTQSLPDLGMWYQLDGTLDTSHGNYDRHTAVTLGPWAVGAMAHSQQAVDALATELVAVPTGDGAHDAEYYPRSLRALTLLTLSGRFTRCGGASPIED